jgi:hypothetical protein
MGTALPELFAALSRDFDQGEVKWRPQGGKSVPYITARTVMNRLDDVLGPCGWWDDYEPHEHSVVCKLTIRLPDGSTVTKQDAGGPADMKDEGDGEKAAYSDAFKRAAVKFGVGRLLYGDGSPTYIAPSLKAVGDETKPASTADSRTFWEYVSDGCGKYNDRFRDAIGNPDALNIASPGTLCDLIFHDAYEAGKSTVKPGPDVPPKAIILHAEEVYANHRPWAQAALKRLLKESYDEAIRNAKAAPVEDKG